jgi:hypothetical protein
MMDVLALKHHIKAFSGLTNMSNRDISNIDRYHDELYEKTDDFSIKAVYEEIRSHPIQYLFANNYLKKLFFYTICPFSFGIIALNTFLLENSSTMDHFELLIILALIWIWFNKNTFFVLIKLFMLSYAIFPYGNIYYYVTGKLIHVRFVKVLLGVVFTLASAQIIFQVVFG